MFYSWISFSADSSASFFFYMNNHVKNILKNINIQNIGTYRSKPKIVFL